MAQYQTFPGAPGDSLTLDKLKLLCFPEMADLSFLDVGCNEGFFCGFAKSQGAKRAVGIDHSAGFIERARKHFPECEFLHQGWETLPEEKFDVILLASALHYADDQSALIARLVDKLTDDGVLILELGIFSSPKNEWVEVERGIDHRFFPTMARLRDVLAPYAWKWMGPSVNQIGDPVGRHVVHISRRKKIVYLLMEPPAYGKSTIAKELFIPAGVQLVSGDHEIGLLARGQRTAADALASLVTARYSPFHLDKLLQAIFDEGLEGELVDLWISSAGNEGFALDSYVPAERHADVMKAFVKRGYLPVKMHWERSGLPLIPSDELENRAEEFYLSLVEGNELSPGKKVAAAGFVDEVAFESDGRIALIGWAVNEAGRLPSQFQVTWRDEKMVIESVSSKLRPDVQQHLGLNHALLGYKIVLNPGPVSNGRLDLLDYIRVREIHEGGGVGALFSMPS